jgi:hypothetical protein
MELTLLSFIDSIILITESQLKEYPLIFLNSDPNKGLNEFSFQLVFYTNLITYKLPKIIVQMEKVIEGHSRCDLLIKDVNTNEIVIIELKYIRLSFLKISRIHSTNDAFKFQKVLEDIHNIIKHYTNAELLKLLKWSDYIVSTKDSVKEEKYEPIENILIKAETQAKTYAKQYQNNLDWRTKQPKIYYLAIIGIGFRIIKGPGNLYHK